MKYLCLSYMNEEKFDGVSWQIVPTILGQLLQDKDAEKAKKVMQAMMEMTSSKSPV